MRLATALSATALAVAVLGSTPLGRAAYEAVLPANSVGTAQLKRGAVTGDKIKNRSVGPADLQARSLTGGHILDGSLLAADFGAGQIPAGPKGDKGDKGDRGDRGEPATRLWVTVADNGSIVRESGGESASRAATGQYFVTFDRDVSQCAWLVSGRVGEARVREQPSPRSVVVEIRSGTLVDSLFHIGAFC